MRLEGSFTVAAPQARVWARITDAALMAGCIPGCESIEVVDARTYRAKVKIQVGPIGARFNLLVEVTEEQAPSRVLSVTRGEEGTRASIVAAENELVLVAQDALTTEVRYASEVSVTGRLGKFGLGVMKKKAQNLSAEFVANFRSSHPRPSDQRAHRAAHLQKQCTQPFMPLQKRSYTVTLINRRSVAAIFAPALALRS